MKFGAFSRGSQAAQKVLSSSSFLRDNVVLGYGVGLVAFIAALVLRFSLAATIPHFPFITFIPAVIVSAFLAGSRAGMFCAALSFLSTWYWFVDPSEPFSTSFNSVVALTLFAFIIAVDIVIIEVAARAVDRLTAQEAQLNTIVETVPLGLVISEFPSGRIVGGNRYVEQMLRHPVLYSPDIQSYDEWVSFHEDGSRVQSHEYPLARMMLHGEENPSIDVHYQRGDGSKAWVRIVGRPVRDKAGRITGGVAALIDINDQHESQLALAEALRIKDLLLYEVNHRVKNSLQLVNSVLILEAEKIGQPDTRAAIVAVRKKIDVIARLHQKLYSNGTHERVDLKSSLDELVQSMLESAGRNDVKVRAEFTGEPSIHIEQASPLMLALTELLTNAIKYGLGADCPELAIVADNAADGLKLTIADNGPGLPPQIEGASFSFGMQIVAALVNQLRGTIENNAGEPGATIVLHIPSMPIDPQKSESH